MKIRTLVILALGILVLSHILPAQETAAPERASQESATIESNLPQPQLESLFARAAKLPSVAPPAPMPPRRYPVQATRTPADSNSPLEVQIFALEHAPAESLGNMITSIFQVETHLDRRLNRLIVIATRAQMHGVENLIQAMDIAGSEASTHQDVQDLVYRIYMFEASPEDAGLKPFSMILQASGHVPSEDSLEATADDGLQVSKFVQSENEFGTMIVIEGKAASNASLMHLVQRFPESHITELKWDDDETFTDEIDAAQYTRLPDQMQKHIAKFLGNDVRTVGYWFGNLSVPGGIVAPIGPWTLGLTLGAESDRMLELTVDVELPAETPSTKSPRVRVRGQDIISNTIRAKIGKPIIIGYNRQSYGTRRMGAMVIIPEAGPFQSDPAKAKTF